MAVFIRTQSSRNNSAASRQHAAGTRSKRSQKFLKAIAKEIRNQIKLHSCFEIPSLPALRHCYTLAALPSVKHKCGSRLNPFAPFMLSREIGTLRHSDLREAISIEKRYFTSDLSSLS